MSLRYFHRDLALALLLGAISLAGPAAAQARPAPPVSDEARAVLTRKMAEAIERTRDIKVVYQDVLGEGEGAWDPDPRYPTDTVNCITWLYLLLAEVYGDTPEEKLEVMDRVRYFDGHVGFGFRKHYTDQWTEIDPLPLRKVDFKACPSSAVKTLHLQLDPDRFAKNIRYGCPLYHRDKTSFDLEVVPPHGLVQCAGGLAPGYYVLFPVATERYLQKYGGFSGPMGQVHTVLLEVPPRLAPGSDPDSRDAGSFKVLHASISRGKVVETELASYVLHMWNLYSSYVVYELVPEPDWDWRSTPPMDEEAKAVAACEAKLEGSVARLFENEVQPAPKKNSGSQP